MREILELDATAQADLVRRGEVTARELVETTVLHIERTDPALNAVVLPLFDRALAEAATPRPEAPFGGVPMLVKDLLANVAGVPTTAGSRYARQVVPPTDSALVARYRRAGLIPVGKTNTSELGLLPVTEPAWFGPCRNPWDLSRTPGGSSGGAAVAVATRMAAIAHASDGAGSLRVPAACCGVFGFKPSRGLAPAVGELDAAQGHLVVEHVITRSVRDSAGLVGLPHGIPEEVGPLKVALITHSPFGAPCEAACVAAAESAGRLLEDLGHAVEPASLPLRGTTLAAHLRTVWSAGAAATLDALGRLLGPPRPGDLEPYTRELAGIGREVSASEYLLARGQLIRAVRRVLRFCAGYDVVLTPSLGRPPLPLGSFSGLGVDESLALILEFSPFAFLANLTGQPAMSVPLASTRDGLPLGVHFAGRAGGDAILLALARQLERAKPWGASTPPGVDSRRGAL